LPDQVLFGGWAFELISRWGDVCNRGSWTDQLKGMLVMRIRNIFLSVISFVVVLFLSPLAVLGQAPVPHSSHVVFVMDENTSYATTLAQMQWLVTQGSAYGYTTNYVSNTNGSAMDYFWVASGSCHSSANCALPTGTISHATVTAVARRLPSRSSLGRG
jgi:hypothetical protein